MKPIRRRILARIKRGQTWLEQAKNEFEQNRPRAGEKKLELAMAELRLAREKSEFWGWQEPPRKRKVLPLVAGLCCTLLLAGGIFLLNPGTSDYSPHVTERIEIERNLSLPLDYVSKRREPRILEDNQFNSFASFQLERELEGLIVPTDL